MRFLLILFLSLTTGVLSGQSLQFAFEGDSITVPFVRDSLRGISGLETVSGDWHFVSDRGWHYVFTNIKNINDLRDSTHLKLANKTPFWFEGVRYNPKNATYFWTDEHEFVTSLWAGKSLGDTSTGKILLKMPLASENKGLEGIALTHSGALWVAPEAGWEGQTQMTQDTITFFRYANPLAADPVVERYAYPMNRCDFAQGEERQNGISELLAVDENQLLVLERCYDARQRQLTARLYVATSDVATHTLRRELAFDFNQQFPGIVCNLEAMAWTDDTKQAIVLMADDNFRRNRTLRNQMIVLRKR
ncbi:hypothetical protein GCM10028807_51340 [Spirosoma daeguense]